MSTARHSERTWNEIILSGPPVPNHTSGLEGSFSISVPLVIDSARNLDFLERSSGALVQQSSNLHSYAVARHEQTSARIPTPLIQRSPIPILHIPLSPVKGRDHVGAPRAPRGGPMTPGQASLFDSLFSLGDYPPTEYTHESRRPSVARDLCEERNYSVEMIREQGSTSHSQAKSTNVDTNNTDTSSSEYLLVGLLNELVLDREVESNIVPFIAHAFTSWIDRFLLEPTRLILLARDMIIRGHSLGVEKRQKMILIANTVLTVSKSTGYDLTHYTNLYNQLMKNLLMARAQKELAREAAMEAMDSCHIAMGSFANILNLMGFYAPVFRRACPESGGLVNLPRRLIAIEVNLKYYATFDVFFSLITHHPMFFRYDLDFLSPQDEELLNAPDGPGLRWLYGLPDRLVVVLARMNTLLEGGGNRVDQETIRDIEKEIEACTTVVSPTTENDPVLKIGRVMVQESWKLAAHIYLYMGPGGADSWDPQVIKTRKRFMRLLECIKPGRNPDSFLVVPIMILGIATSSYTEQSTLLTRLWGVSECSIPGTMGNDLVRILMDIWARTTERPAVWSDLRTACLKVTGM